MAHQKNLMRIYHGLKSNKEVMEMAGYKSSLLKTIRKRQLQFFEHIYKQS